MKTLFSLPKLLIINNILVKLEDFELLNFALTSKNSLSIFEEKSLWKKKMENNGIETKELEGEMKNHYVQSLLNISIHSNDIQKVNNFEVTRSNPGGCNPAAFSENIIHHCISYLIVERNGWLAVGLIEKPENGFIVILDDKNVVGSTESTNSVVKKFLYFSFFFNFFFNFLKTKQKKTKQKKGLYTDSNYFFKNIKVLINHIFIFRFELLFGFQKKIKIKK